MSSLSRRNVVFFANSDRTAQKIKKFQIVLSSLRLVLTFQSDIQDICQIQHNFKTLQANKFIENYEIETFSKFSVLQETAGLQNKGLCSTKCLSFCNLLLSQKLKCRAEKKYIITDGMR